MRAILSSVLSAVLSSLIWFAAYVLPLLGLAGFVGIPLAHIWVDFSWWWMLAPVAAEAIWVFVVIGILDSIGG